MQKVLGVGSEPVDAEKVLLSRFRNEHLITTGNAQHRQSADRRRDNAPNIDRELWNPWNSWNPWNHFYSSPSRERTALITSADTESLSRSALTVIHPGAADWRR